MSFERWIKFSSFEGSYRKLSINPLLSSSALSISEKWNKENLEMQALVLKRIIQGLNNQAIKAWFTSTREPNQWPGLMSKCIWLLRIPSVFFDLSKTACLSKEYWISPCKLVEKQECRALVKTRSSSSVLKIEIEQHFDSSIHLYPLKMMPVKKLQTPNVSFGLLFPQETSVSLWVAPVLESLRREALAGKKDAWCHLASYPYRIHRQECQDNPCRMGELSCLSQSRNRGNWDQ